MFGILRRAAAATILLLVTDVAWSDDAAVREACSAALLELQQASMATTEEWKKLDTRFGHVPLDRLFCADVEPAVAAYVRIARTPNAKRLAAEATCTTNWERIAYTAVMNKLTPPDHILPETLMKSCNPEGARPGVTGPATMPDSLWMGLSDTNRSTDRARFR